MLILTRKPGESVYIGDNVKITIVEIKGHQIRVGIDAPKELRIYREEIYEQIREENRQAASQEGSDAGLESLSAAWGNKLGKGGVSKLSSMKVSSAGTPGGGEGEGSSSKGGDDDDDDPNPPGSGPAVVVRRKKRSS